MRLLEKLAELAAWLHGWKDRCATISRNRDVSPFSLRQIIKDVRLTPEEFLYEFRRYESKLNGSDIKGVGLSRITRASNCVSH